MADRTGTGRVSFHVPPTEYDPLLFEPSPVTYLAEMIDPDPSYVDAKAFLQQKNSTWITLYDHLANILTQVLDERPRNPADMFEEMSKEQKRSRYVLSEDMAIERGDKATEVALAEIQQKLFSRRGAGGSGDGGVDEEGDEEDDFEEEELEDDEASPLPNLLETCYYFEQGGFFLNRDEIIRIWLALKALISEHSFEMVRFWGKIFGTEQNYIVAEVKYTEGAEEEEDAEEEEEEEEDEDDEPEDEGDSDDDDEDDEEGGTKSQPLPEIPPPKVKPDLPQNIPMEEKGTGANKFTYFVCVEPGKPWIKLPPVTPVQISVARLIKKYFTGRLDALVTSYPPFPGTEINYLRAQIARISAATQISPLGYFHFPEEEGEEEGLRENYIIAEEYEPPTVRQLTADNETFLRYWVHHTLHILPQGRTRWVNAVVPGEPEESKGEEEEEEKAEEVIKPEVGPPLLTPLKEDKSIKDYAPWTTTTTSRFVPKYAVAMIHSTLWPGAHAYARGKKFENVYIGWGHKYTDGNYNPTAPPPIQKEYPHGPEITETTDPNAQDRAQYLLDLANPKPAKDVMLDEEEEDEEEEDAEED